mgnify:CR=1 FL=1
MLRRNVNKQIAIFLPSFRGGGAERVMLNLAKGFANRGFKVDLVLVKAVGPYSAEVPPLIRVVDFRSNRVLFSLWKLVRFLRKERPAALLSAMDHANIIAIWAKQISGIKTQVVVTVHNTLSQSIKNASVLRIKLLPLLMRWFYPWANGIVCVSQGVANDLSFLIKLPLDKIKVIYNPIITPEFLAKAEEPLHHPWFNKGEPPIILGVGRLTKLKDFTTLIKAFDIVRRKRQARLMILGEGEERLKLEALVKRLGLEGEVVFPGFMVNPYKYMKRASVFVLSSRSEGFALALAEAMALGIPVVATDCPNGPYEILDGGKFGSLVPIGDYKKLAEEIMKNLDIPKTDIAAQHAMKNFALERILNEYIQVLGL